MDSSCASDSAHASVTARYRTIGLSNTVTSPDLDQEFFFAWEGADSSNPWRHLRVVEFHGREAISELYMFELQLHRDEDALDVNVEDLIGSQAALKLFTRTEPAWRIIHGVITSAVELGDVRRGSRYRVELRPPFVRSSIVKTNYVHIERRIRTAIDETLVREPLGAGLEEVSGTGKLVTHDQLDRYTPPKLRYEWRILDETRLDDPEARPYCVQYAESDWAFVSRLLEEEGISYHFEHGDDECRVVFTDFDGGRVKEGEPLSPDIAGREIPRWNAGARLRPRSVFLDDYNWRKPQLELGTASRSGVTPFTTFAHPGRYEHSKQTGEILATVREQRFDSERQYSSAEGRCRVLGAGSVFRLEHPKEKFNGSYLVTAVHHQGRERGWFGDEEGQFEPYMQQLECLRCGSAGSPGESSFRPARLTPMPRIYGTQTAVVTADPSAPDAEINVGGPHNLGCVRVLFRWDLAGAARFEKGEPTSCFVRVSQFFAGSNHGALWHPRVGDEVIVECLDGDPDQPIITGRVYNGRNHAPANATERPTYSAIQSLTSPHNGNYNLIAFEDLQGEEEISMHAARDMKIDIERNYTRNTKAHDAINAGSQSISVGSTQTIDVGTTQTITVGADQTITVGGPQTINANSGETINVTGNQTFIITGKQLVAAGVKILGTAPTILFKADLFHAKGGSIAALTSDGTAAVIAPTTQLVGKSDLTASSAAVKIVGGTVKVSGSSVDVEGGPVKIKGSPVDISGGTINIKGGTVNVTGGPIKLNC